MAKKKETVPVVENVTVVETETRDYSVGGVMERTRKTNIFALLSLITAFLFFIPLNNVLSIIFGHVALKQLKENTHQTGVGIAKAGLIISYTIVGFIVLGVLSLFGLLLWGLFLGAFSAGATIMT
jgi:hypothetical protein